MISKEIIDRVKDAANIVDIISDFVSLKKQGTVYKGNCPFHNENTPSFVVSPAKGIFKCFGCGESGDAISFVEKYEHVEFIDAIKIIANKYHIDLPEQEYSNEEKQAIAARKKNLEHVANQAKQFADKLKQNKEAITYLQTRNISGKEAKDWNIGFADSGFFANRIVFPILNEKGETVGFTGRTIINDFAKYKNSPESDLFNKSKLLFGFYQAKHSIAKHDKVYIVEGQLDVIAMHRIGITNTVAPSGTAFTAEQTKMLKKLTSNFVLIKDADKAGINSMLKGIPALLKAQINVRIITLPESKDPDNIVNENTPETAKVFFDKAREVDFVEFITEMRKQEIEESPAVAGQYLNEIRDYIAMIDDANTRKMYAQRCADIFRISTKELLADIKRLKPQEPQTGRLFGLDTAIDNIRLQKKAVITTSYDAVITDQLNNEQSIMIGLNGSLLEASAIEALKDVASHVVINEYFEGFKRDAETTTLLNLKKLFFAGIDITITEDEDVDMETGEVHTKYINFVDYYISRIAHAMNIADNNSVAKAIESVAELVSYLPETLRMTKINFIKDVFKNEHIKFNVGDFKKVLSRFVKKNAKFDDGNNAELNTNGLQLTDEQYDMLNQYQHYYDTKRNCIMHIDQGGQMRRISNFIITPIIHSNNSAGHFKLFEIKNESRLVRQISLETKDLNDVKRFKNAVEAKGNFIFKGTQYQLDNIKECLYMNTTYSNEVENLGWQQEGFWAWASGIKQPQVNYKDVDKNGIITFNNESFLIKPFSALYANDRTAYVNEKKFRRMTSDVSMEEWASQYYKVFGENAMIGVCALLTTVYSDAIFKLVYNELPIINYFGPKGAGKTQQADSLLAFFGEKQPINNLSKVTIYGLSQTLKSFNNAFVLIDEYKNSLDMKWIEFLKSIYNRQGKIQGNISKEGTKTEQIPINSMALLCGQDLPTLDVALLDRCLCLTASRTEFSNDEKNEYKKLKQMEDKGLTHITDQLIDYRDIVLDNFERVNNEIQEMLSSRISNVSTRLQKNLNTILTPFKILENKFQFPFTFEEVLDYGCNIIQTQQKFIESTDDLRNFWTIFQTLIEQEKIYEGKNYILQDIIQLDLIGFNEPIQFHVARPILFLRWGGLYPLYAEFSKRSGMVALGEKTLQFYLENQKKYYLGKVRSKKFFDRLTKQQWVNNAYVFDYETLGIDLAKSESVLTPDSESNTLSEDDLKIPF